MAEKIIRVFPRRTKWTPTDELAFVGDPPLIRPAHDIPVYISVTFSWDVEEGKKLLRAWGGYYEQVYLGGPAFGLQHAPNYKPLSNSREDYEFVPGRFIKPGVTITSRGCPYRCSWCLVPEREGNIRELEIKDGYIVQDNNLLACSESHIEMVFEMLRRQKRGAVFAGGLDIKLLQRWHVELLKSIRVNEIWVSYDSFFTNNDLSSAARLLKDFPTEKKRCYVLVGYNGEPIEKAELRLSRALGFGFLPFAMWYRAPEDKKQKHLELEERAFLKKWCRPAAYRGKLKIEFVDGGVGFGGFLEDVIDASHADVAMTGKLLQERDWDAFAGKKGGEG